MIKGDDFLFKSLYLLISFFIAIGEATKLIVIFLFNSVKTLYLILIQTAKDVWKKIKKGLRKIRIPAITFPKVQIPEITIPSIKLPKIHLPKIPIPKVRRPFHFLGFLPLRIRYFLLGSIVTIILVLFYQGYLFVRNLPNPATIGKINYPLSSHIYDRNGKLLYEIFREQNRTPVLLRDLPPHIYQATIAIEDKDFYEHKGISLIGGIVRAIKDTFIEKNLQGGSTITQQLVKSALLTPERTVQRKIKEIILALWAEQLFSKDKILEMYLNQVPYGGSSYGIEEAAKVYFGKSAKELSLEESALLAGLPQAPSVYSPHVNPALALERRNEVLRAMRKQRFINQEQFEKALATGIEVVPPKTSIRAPHFVFYAKSDLESLYGTKAVEEGGFRVTTSLDLDIQEEAEKILREELNKIQNLNVTNGAILITRPSTGEILAMVGSVDYFEQPSGAFNVTTALRQPGSSVKPIMYSLALQKNYTAASIIDDLPVVFSIAGSEVYKPVNYDGKFHGKIPLRYALANSYNVPAVKVLSTVGVQNFISYASKMGITTWRDSQRYGLSLTLGGGEVTMLDMAEAFGVFANAGYKTDLTSFIKVEDAGGSVIREMSAYKLRVLSEGISYIISDILSDNFARQWAFGPQSAIVIPGYQVAVKTGTTNDKKDNWTIGYTPDFLVAVWVGNNDNTPMNPYLTSGITGAAPIWNRVMSFVLKKYSSGNRWFTKPEDIVEIACYFGRKEYFLKGTEKSASCAEQLFGTTPTPTPNP